MEIKEIVINGKPLQDYEKEWLCDVLEDCICRPKHDDNNTNRKNGYRILKKIVPEYRIEKQETEDN